VEVIVGILENKSLDVNKRFFTFHEKQRPYIILKWAQSQDKKIGSTDNNRIFISNAITNRLVHQWRSEEAAIMVGTNTALQDDPSLTTRLVTGKNPVRLVIDMDLKLPATLHLFDGSVKTVVFNAVKEEEHGQLLFCKMNANESIIPQILDTLYHQKIQSVIIEGGAILLQSFIDAGIWDEARVITNANLEIENGVAAPQLKNYRSIEQQILDTDTIDYFLNDSF
jgi:diaminohydroxyphosphoribosylaminopyrimidine deaminase/5-amino-6-(5-phosphoribosylamino)uracil reductase